jgi:hypothetical protein
MCTWTLSVASISRNLHFLGEVLLYHLGHGFDTVLYFMFNLFLKVLYLMMEKKTPTQN